MIYNVDAISVIEERVYSINAFSIEFEDDG